MSEPIRVECKKYACYKDLIISSRFPCLGLVFSYISLSVTVIVHWFLRPQFLVLSHIFTVFDHIAFF
jgi:hypothetical protein